MNHQAARDAAAEVAFVHHAHARVKPDFPRVRPQPEAPPERELTVTVTQAARILVNYGATPRDVGPSTWVELIEKAGWKEDAACKGSDPDLFFPEKRYSAAAPRRICVGCPVRAECLATALNVVERFGVWGGLSPEQRKAIRLGR